MKNYTLRLDIVKVTTDGKTEGVEYRERRIEGREFDKVFPESDTNAFMAKRYDYVYIMVPKNVVEKTDKWLVNWQEVIEVSQEIWSSFLAPSWSKADWAGFWEIREDKILEGVPDKRLNTPVRLIERHETGVRILTDHGAEPFDAVVVATHTDQALGMLTEPSRLESEVLGAIRYQDNHAVLHTDASVLPANAKAWAAWNYERAVSNERESSRVCLHYLLNRLQRIPFSQPVVVSLNPVQDIRADTILGEYDYAHPVFDMTAIAAQQRLPLLQGQRNTWFAGAWAGYGFHEDGLKSGMQVGRALLANIKASQGA
jgi:hypothetical protein